MVAASKLIVLTRYTYAVQLESNFVGSSADFSSQTIRPLSIQSAGRPDKRNPAPWLVRTTRDAVGRQRQLDCIRGDLLRPVTQTSLLAGPARSTVFQLHEQDSAGQDDRNRIRNDQRCISGKHRFEDGFAKDGRVSRSPSRLKELRAQHQAFDLVGAAFDFVRIVREVDVFDHGAALEHGGRALQLQVLDQRDGVAFGELCAVGWRKVPCRRQGG